MALFEVRDPPVLGDRGWRPRGLRRRRLRRGRFGRQLRLNYRFDAVSSIGVDVVSRASNFLELSLTNGPARKITITEPVSSGYSAPEETDDELSNLNLEAAGFVNALHILEGIAAEGKTWMDRDPVLSGDEDWGWEQSA